MTFNTTMTSENTPIYTKICGLGGNSNCVYERLSSRICNLKNVQWIRDTILWDFQLPTLHFDATIKACFFLFCFARLCEHIYLKACWFCVYTLLFRRSKGSEIKNKFTMTTILYSIIEEMDTFIQHLSWIIVLNFHNKSFQISFSHKNRILINTLGS